MADKLWRSRMHHCTKFHLNRPSGCGDITIIRIFEDGGHPPSWRWWPSTILDSFSAFLDHSRRKVGGLYWCAKIGWNPCSNLDGIKVWIFHAVGSKCLFTPPKFRFFWGGIWPLKWEGILTEPPKDFLLIEFTSWHEVPKLLSLHQSQHSSRSRTRQRPRPGMFRAKAKAKDFCPHGQSRSRTVLENPISGCMYTNVRYILPCQYLLHCRVSHALLED